MLREHFSLKTVADIAKYASELSIDYAHKGVTYLEITNMFVNEILERKNIEQARNNIEQMLIEIKVSN